MKNFISFLIVCLLIISCASTKNTSDSKAISSSAKNDTVRIANDELEYEVIIIDAGFSNWLASRARPRNFYTQDYMETRNRVWVANWNINVNSSIRNRDLFLMSINYENHIDYGYEVNYLLFNYLTYFQITNNIQLGGFSARI